MVIGITSLYERGEYTIEETRKGEALMTTTLVGKSENGESRRNQKKGSDPKKGSSIFHFEEGLFGKINEGTCIFRESSSLLSCF